MREKFPRGLKQPENGFHFALDSLLLASFAGKLKGRVADLGCGCGVIGFGLLLNGSQCQVLGIEREKEMLDAVLANRAGLDFFSRYDLLGADIRHISRVLPAGAFDAVVSNPPFRQTGRGRVSSFTCRNSARFEEYGGIEDFVQAGAWLLRSRGSLYFVFLAERLDHLLCAMRTNRVFPKTVLPVASKKNEPAKFVLVKGRKDGGEGMTLLSPLVLYDERGHFCRESLEFCPFLACNSR